VHRPEGQVAFVDTPGIHEAKGALHRRMVETAMASADEADLVLLLVEPTLGKDGRPALPPATRALVERLGSLRTSVLLVVNKVDAVEKPLLLPFVAELAALRPASEVLLVSARTGDGVDHLLQTVLARLPEGPPLFDASTFTDQQERGLAAELIREQVLRHTRQEVPHAAAVVVEEFDESERAPRPGAAAKGGLQGLVRIFANLYLERESQKAIVIGKRGAMLKTIGTDARKALERLLGAHVYLDLRVKVEPRWTETEAGLRKVGLK
jgi:GTP-binding protein Era